MRNQATPTTYKGIPMRSRVEAEYAMALDANGIKWQYEPMQYADATGTYKPDFQVGKHRFVEVKADRDAARQALQRMHVIRATDPEAELRVVVGTWSGSAYSFRKSDGMTCDNDNPCKECRPRPTLGDTRGIPRPADMGRLVLRIRELEAELQAVKSEPPIVCPDLRAPLSFHYEAGDPALRCPNCGGEQTHIDHVEADDVCSVIIEGWCEHCLDRFGITFRQHKGDTFVECNKADGLTIHDLIKQLDAAGVPLSHGRRQIRDEYEFLASNKALSGAQALRRGRAWEAAANKDDDIDLTELLTEAFPGADLLD